MQFRKYAPSHWIKMYNNVAHHLLVTGLFYLFTIIFVFCILVSYDFGTNTLVLIPDSFR